MAVNRKAAALGPLLSDGPFCEGTADYRLSLAGIGFRGVTEIPGCTGPPALPRLRALNLGLPRSAERGTGARPGAGTAGEPAEGQASLCAGAAGTRTFPLGKLGRGGACVNGAGPVVGRWGSREVGGIWRPEALAP